jgi:protein gp37
MGEYLYGGGYNNVWLGVTAENQEMADRRIPILLQIPAVVRFVSVEPMIGSVDLDDLTLRFADRSEHHFNALSCDVDVDDDGDFHGKCLDWVICGGESGPNPRPMEEEWAYDLLNQCRYAGVKFFMKQMSGRQPIPDYLNVREFPGK